MQGYTRCKCAPVPLRLKFFWGFLLPFLRPIFFRHLPRPPNRQRLRRHIFRDDRARCHIRAIAIAAGKYPVTAKYNGDASDVGSSSTTVTVTVN
jgi:hypothetical protein